MWPVFPATTTLPLVLVMLAAVLAAIFVIQPAWGRARGARIAVLATFGGIFAGAALWGVGRAAGDLRFVHLGAGITYAGVLVLGPAAFAMPIAAATSRILVRVAAPRGRDADDGPRVTRRALIHFGSASFPAVAAIGGASGLASAKRPPSTPVVRLRFPGLHPDLEGLRILQLSDLHLGVYFGLDDLARALEAAKTRLRPDLVVLTGDLADDPALISGALRLVAAVNARYGALASLGNHEYLHGIEATRPKYEASAVPLLVGTGRALRVGRATLFVGGADDPVHMGGDIAWMLTPSIESSIARAPAHADFRLLLCHRPEGHGPAAAAGYDLTLSGHTHGGQIGLFGRSLFEKLRPGIGWWGAYEKRRADGAPSRLYTTSGFGHWFPFRFGCPTEMPLVVLEGDGPRAGDRA